MLKLQYLVFKNYEIFNNCVWSSMTTNFHTVYCTGNWKSVKSPQTNCSLVSQQGCVCMWGGGGVRVSVLQEKWQELQSGLLYPICSYRVHQVCLFLKIAFHNMNINIRISSKPAGMLHHMLTFNSSICICTCAQYPHAVITISSTYCTSLSCSILQTQKQEPVCKFGPTHPQYILTTELLWAIMRKSNCNKHCPNINKHQSSQIKSKLMKTICLWFPLWYHPFVY